MSSGCKEVYVGFTSSEIVEVFGECLILKMLSYKTICIANFLRMKISEAGSHIISIRGLLCSFISTIVLYL